MAVKKREKQDPKDAGNNYVDNKEFLQEMILWKNDCKASELKGEDRPPMSEEIGAKIMLIADGVGRKNNFNGYSYRDEMVLDGIENCVRYGHNFDADKYTNPFAYFSQMIYYAFLRRIAHEKKQANIKKKCIEMAIDDPRYMHDLGASGTSAGALAEMQKKLAGETLAYEESVKTPKKRKTSSSSSSSTPELLFK